ncbi:MAG: cadmium-translocating P-type ATPase [Magnetospirillum sp. WYHS-4]
MTTQCLHCSQDIPPSQGGEFCCHGCEAAYHLVRGLGLEGYYARRCVDPAQRPLRPEDGGAPIDYGTHVHEDEGGIQGLNLMVEGLHCAACVWLIESILSRQPGVVTARVNMTTRRLVLKWRKGEAEADALVGAVNGVGYRLVPFDPGVMDRENARQEKELLRAMAVAGFVAGNVMLFSVSVWAGHVSGMGQATRDLMHWLSALITLPAIAYAGRPFFHSALAALRHLRTNMDVPISVGVLLTAGMSLWETVRGGPHAYFDSAIMLLFFLLIGRYLDRRARGRARASAEHLLTLSALAVTVIDEEGRRHMLPPARVKAGMTVLAVAGDRIGVDGTVIAGRSDIDTSLISGETLPQPVEAGSRVFAGTLNLSGPLTLRVDAVGEGTLLAEIVRLMEAAEQGRAKYVALADRVARFYAPVVHLLALCTFLAWVFGGGMAWQEALLIAAAVLIITCPCALALAVPVVQVVASGRLLRQGILVKSGSALERLARTDTVVFDKTGTLTLGRAEPIALDGLPPDDLRLATAMAGASRHPLARALVKAMPGVPVAAGVEEIPGRGLRLGDVRLGSRAWIGAPEAAGEIEGPELWLHRPGTAPLRIAFCDPLRSDAAATVAALKAAGCRVALLSGDRAPVVEAAAREAGIEDWRAAMAPADKCKVLDDLRAEGRNVLMVGDGLNDAPALAAADVSLSPSTAVDVSQTAADAIFQGQRLGSVAEVVAVARLADRLVKQNFAMAFVYNVVTVPMAMAGLVTPLIAAAAMSGSSLLVIVNALRLGRRRA